MEPFGSFHTTQTKNQHIDTVNDKGIWAQS